MGWMVIPSVDWLLILWQPEFQAWMAPVICAVGVIVYFSSDAPLSRFFGGLMGIGGALVTILQIWLSGGLRLDF